MYRLKRSLLALLIVISAITFDTAFIAYGSTFHRQWLRNKVASKVFEIRGGIEHSSGGATGFAIKGLSGMSYIITNAHVCEEVLRETKSQNLLFVKKDGHLLKRRVLEIFDTTDLCLIEGWPGVEGLSVGKDLDIGSVVYEVGHPHLMPT